MKLYKEHCQAIEKDLPLNPKDHQEIAWVSESPNTLLPLQEILDL